MSTMVTLLSTLPLTVVSLMSEEAQEQARLTLVPAPVAAKPRKANPRAMTVSALATFGSGKDRKSHLEAVVVDNRVHEIVGATKNEIGKAFDAVGKIDIEGIEKTDLVAGFAFRKNGKVVQATESCVVDLIKNQLVKIERLKAETGRRSTETREAVAELAQLKAA